MSLTLKEWRRAKGVSQAEMAEICGVHPNTYRTWEENPEEIKISNAILIANRLGLEVEDIFLSENITEPGKYKNEAIA